MQSIIRTLSCMSLALVMGSLPAYALKNDQSQPINVTSVEQSADLQANKLVFSGDVEATQGTIKLNADKVEVTRSSDGALKSIIAFGSPVRFEQKQDNGHYIRSTSKTLSYFPAQGNIVLQGRAIITQGESKMSGERIEYNISTQKLRAVNNNIQGGRVSSTFVPADFSNKK